jgi:hypothetical protein
MSNTNPQKMGLNPGARKGRVNSTFYKTLSMQLIFWSVLSATFRRSVVISRYRKTNFILPFKNVKIRNVKRGVCIYFSLLNLLNRLKNSSFLLVKHITHAQTHQLILKHYIVNTHFEIMVRFLVYFSEQLVLQLFWLLL